ncbi:MAG: FtsK/SpoIIIE domain-containing protein, partial [Oscillospiraceae bacterium]|nr:FtsK/SpoIIIE domain-containing protein [Oscillospiraceae bacterium]
FKGRNGKYPHFIRLEKIDKKEILHFKSNIPAGEWKKNIDRLESAFNCSIRRIEQSQKSKKIVKLTTVSTDYQIPEMIRWNDKLIDNGDGVMVIGVSDLDTLKFDLNRTPHVLAAGETGSGKSVILRCMLWQMINKGCRIYMIDFKGGVEFGKAYEQYGEVITERERALIVLEMLVNENAKRLTLFRDLEVKNLKEYNSKTGSNLCRIGVFCDEIAEMLDTKGVAKSEKQIYEKLEGALSTLARLSRATGINLFLGVQRPDANVLTGQIKNNVPVRISGRFADKAASEIVLGNTSACDLPDVKGRFIYKMGNETVEFQSYYFDDDKDLRDREELEQDLGITQGDLLTHFEDAPTVPDTIPQTPLISQIQAIRADIESINMNEEDFEYG